MNTQGKGKDELHHFRVGIGHDTHRFTSGDSILLGGISVAHTRSLLGHSDADVLLHAITDAILGAAALGDIGDLFPDTAPENKGRPSSEMLRIAHEKVKREHWEIVNLDCTVFAERPKLGPSKEKIRDNIANLLELSPRCVNIKAKTGEKVGPIGREEAIGSECIVLLQRKPPIS